MQTFEQLFQLRIDPSAQVRLEEGDIVCGDRSRHGESLVAFSMAVGAQTGSFEPYHRRGL